MQSTARSTRERLGEVQSLPHDIPLGASIRPPTALDPDALFEQFAHWLSRTK